MRVVRARGIRRGWLVVCESEDEAKAVKVVIGSLVNEYIAESLEEQGKTDKDVIALKSDEPYTDSVSVEDKLSRDEPIPGGY